MKLAGLEPQFIARTDRGHHKVSTIVETDGIVFLCPRCFAAFAADPSAGCHSIRVWFEGRGVPAEETPGPARWQASGTGYHDLTLQPSINLDCGPEPRGCRWHGWITNGEAFGA